MTERDLSKDPTATITPEAPGVRLDPGPSFAEFPAADVAGSIPMRFARQVAEHADRPALIDDGGTFTYREVDSSANRLAHAILGARGEGPESVAVLIETGASMVVASMAVHKAGKTYVPLDPALPLERARYILEDSQSVLVVANGRHLALAEDISGPGIPVIDVDQLDPDLPADDPALVIAPDAAAWILYTSGSTGQPKGVVQTHRNVLHYVMNYTNSFCVCPEDRHAMLFSCSVNAGCHEILLALLTGASLHIWDVKVQGLTGLADWLIRERITVYRSVPTLLRHLGDTLTREHSFPDLRLIRLVGEPVYRRDFDIYREHFADTCTFVDRLGSTETGSILWYFMDKESSFPGHAVPVGYPVRDHEILLLDDSGREVGPGEIGQIAVRSRYLSPGYWRKPDRTAAAFLPDPDGGDRRIYLTGDMGHRLPDGRYVDLGREDSQVKIRGYRIEIAEVEAALLAMRQVKETIVRAREDRPGEPRLVAYVVADGPDPPSVSSIRRHLAEKLPGYMIPSAYVVMDSLPLAPNGKVYLKGLPVPSRQRPELDTPFVAPLTPVERALAEIWANVLDLEEVGTDDDFLAVGGNSLLATRVRSRILDMFQVDVPLKDMSRAPTVAGMALAVLAAGAAPEAVAEALAEAEGLDSASA